MSDVRRLPLSDTEPFARAGVPMKNLFTPRQYEQERISLLRENFHVGEHTLFQGGRY